MKKGSPRFFEWLGMEPSRQINTVHLAGQGQLFRPVPLQVHAVTGTGFTLGDSFRHLRYKAHGARSAAADWNSRANYAGDFVPIN